MPLEIPGPRVADRVTLVLSLPLSDFSMTLPLSRNVDTTRSFSSVGQMCLGRGVISLALALLLSSCGNLPWRAESSLRPVARRRAVPTSQRQEARMARPTSLGSEPVVDYGVYKRIYPGMDFTEVQSLLGHEGQRYDVAAETDNLTQGERDSDTGLFWRWTHPSGVYNIHVRLKAGEQPETLAVQSKWLTYNPPE